MIGQGRPPQRLSSSTTAAVVWRWIQMRALNLALLVHICAGPSLLGQEPPADGVGLRIVWGGGATATWNGSITLSSGSFDRLVPLGLGRDDNVTIDVQGPRLVVRQWLASNYNGCDVRVNADRKATLQFDFTSSEHPGEHWTREVKLEELLANPLTVALDSRQNRISLLRAPGDELQVEFEQDHLIFDAGSTTKIRVRPVASGFTPSAEGKLRIFTRPSGSAKGSLLAEVPLKSNEAGDFPTIEPISVKIPDKEGVYDWDIALVENQRRGPFNSEYVTRTRRVQYVAFRNEVLPPAQPEAWQEEFAIDPTNPERWTMRLQGNQLKLPVRYPALLANGASTEQVNGQAMTRLAPKGWQAIPLPIDRPGAPHILEVEYRSSQPLALGISLLEPNALNAIPAIGIDSGIRVPSSTIQSVASAADTIERHQITFWPTSKLPYLILANHDEQHDAVYGKIRVLAGPASLPWPKLDAPATFKRFGDAMQPDSANAIAKRRRMLFLERPTFAQAMNAAQVLDESRQQLLDDWTTIYNGADRLVQYLKANAYDGLALTVAADGTAIFPSQSLRPTPRWDSGSYFSTGQDPLRKDVLQLLYRMFDRAGLQLVPVIEFSARMPNLESRRDDAKSAEIDLISADGQTWGGQPGQQNRPPYNPLNPEVQSELEGLVRETAARYCRHQAFCGIGIGINRRSVVAFPDAQWGWDNASVQAFASNSRIALPEFRNASTQPLSRNLLDQYRQQWLQWRGQQIARLFGKFGSVIQTHSSTGRLYVIPIDEFSNVIPIRAIAETIDAQPQNDRLALWGIESNELQRADQVIVLDAASAGRMESASATKISLGEDLRPPRAEAGTVFDHEATWAHFEQFEKQNPWGLSAPIIRMQQLTPGGFWNRRRYAVALAQCDRAIILDGGSTIAQGQEGALTNWTAVLAALPAIRFDSVSPSQANFDLPLVVRQAQLGSRLYFYALNHSPWTLDVEVDVAAQRLDSLHSLSAMNMQAVVADAPGRIRIVLPPFEIAAATIEGQAAVRDFRAQLPPQSVNQMQREIQDLKAKLANVEPNSAMPLLENPSFESAGPNEEILGWQVDPANRGRIELDRQTSYDGNGSLAVHGTGESLRVRSTALVAPATGRVTITAWIRSDEANALPPRFTIEGDDGESSVRSFSVEPTAVPNRTSEPWRQFAAHFDELPVDARQLRIGFDSSQAGSVWIDRVEIHDRWLDQSEVQSLKQLLNLASFKLQEQGDAVGCLRILESYWPRFVDDQYSSTVESARAPELPSGERRLK